MRAGSGSSSHALMATRCAHGKDLGLSFCGPFRLSAHSAFTTSVLVRIGEVTNRTLVLPMLVFYPTSRCSSRCLSCDWWKQTGEGDLTLDEIAEIAQTLLSLGTRLVAFSGGEPPLRPDVFRGAALFRAQGIDLHLQTSGIRRAPIEDILGRDLRSFRRSLDVQKNGVCRQCVGSIKTGWRSAPWQ